jgi:hypothetical protein
MFLMILDETCTWLEFGGWFVLLILDWFLMILAFERCDDVCMENMKMLISQHVFNDFG